MSESPPENESGFSKFAIGFSNAFGSARAFGISVGAVLVWLATMPLIGPTKWNSSVGLAGNTTTGVLELFLGIAVQYAANRVEKQQREHMSALESAMERIEHLEQAVDLRLTAEFSALTARVNNAFLQPVSGTEPSAPVSTRAARKRAVPLSAKDIS